MFDIKDFLNRAWFKYEPPLGMFAEFDGKEYKIVPDEQHYGRVCIVGDEGKTLGRITMEDGKFVPA